MYPRSGPGSKAQDHGPGVGSLLLRRGEAGVAADTDIMPLRRIPRIGKNADIAMPVWVGDLNVDACEPATSR
jgi:hypothetical protein